MISDERLDEIEKHVKAGGVLSVLTLRELFITIRVLKAAIPVDPVKYVPVPLSRRDWFAGMAMQCLYNADSRSENNIPELIRLISEYSVNIADAMLAELDKEK